MAMLESSTEIAKAFHREIRIKKQAANSVHAKTGKRGYTGTIRFPSSHLKGKAKKNYEKNGEVVSYSMFQTLQTYEEFTRKPESEQKLVMENWRNVYHNSQIMKSLRVGSKTFYKLLADLGIETKPRNNGKPEVVPVDGIPTFEEFQTLDEAGQKDMLILLRQEFSTETIRKAWGLSSGKLYQIIGQLGIPTNKRHSSSKKNTAPIDFVKVLSSGELVPYIEFKRLTHEQQAELLNEYLKIYGKLTELSKAWAVPTQTLYGLSSRMNKVQYTPTERIEIVKEVEEVNMETTEQEVSPLKEQEQVAAAVAEAEVIPLQETPQEERSVSALQDEQLRIMQEQVLQLTAAMQELQKQLTAQEVPQKPTVATFDPSSFVENELNVEPPTSTGGFQLSYEAEKEGFLLEREVRQFIKMLEKNPDSYRVSIKIEKIEE